ncbi:hypothetical protein P4117_21230 [Pseudomonas aeruginosa]|nr:hypothetical protein [Pseudomonas aeruginosa]
MAEKALRAGLASGASGNAGQEATSPGVPAAPAQQQRCGARLSWSSGRSMSLSTALSFRRSSESDEVLQKPPSSNKARSCVVSACESGTTNRFISTARLASQATGRRDRGIVGSPENGPFMPERGAK